MDGNGFDNTNVSMMGKLAKLMLVMQSAANVERISALLIIGESDD